MTNYVTRETTIKAKDVKPGMVMTERDNHYTRLPVQQVVVKVERAADAADRLIALLTKTKGRAKQLAVAQDVHEALLAIADLGREARLITYAGARSFRSYASQDEFRYVRQARKEEMET